MHICFLIYVSRSGSTFLSRLLSEKLDDLRVVPELTFPDNFLAQGDLLSKLSSRELMYYLESDPFLDATGLSSGEIQQYANSIEGQSFRDALESFTRVLDARDKSSYGTVLFKHESFIWHHQKLRREFPQAKFIFLCRDPRAITSSWLRTPLPRFPKENFARGDKLMPMRRWTAFFIQMRSAENFEDTSTMVVRYEDLLDRPGKELDKIRDFLSVEATPRTENKEPNTYTISDKGTGIHQNVFAPPMIERAEGWKTDLNVRVIAAVEYYLAERMRVLGYEPISDLTQGTARRWYLLYRTGGVYHAIRRIFLRVRMYSSEGRLSALFKHKLSALFRRLGS